MIKTNKKITYSLYGLSPAVVIPEGTPCIPADNLPVDNTAGIKYWVEAWPDMSEQAESHMRTYGFGVGDADVDDAGQDDLVLPVDDAQAEFFNDDEA